MNSFLVLPFLLSLVVCGQSAVPTGNSAASSSNSSAPTSSGSAAKFSGLSLLDMVARRPPLVPLRNTQSETSPGKAAIVKRDRAPAAESPAHVQDVAAQPEAVPGGDSHVPVLEKHVPAEDQAAPTEEEAVPAHGEGVPADYVIVPGQHKDVLAGGEEASVDRVAVPAEDPVVAEQDDAVPEPEAEEGDAADESGSSESHDQSSELQDSAEEADNPRVDLRSIVKRAVTTSLAPLVENLMRRLVELVDRFMDLTGAKKLILWIVNKFRQADSVVPLRQPIHQLYVRSVPSHWRAVADQLYHGYHNYALKK